MPFNLNLGIVRAARCSMASDTGAGTPPAWDPEAGKERVKEHYQSLLGNSYTW
jgi:hypothetical protein